MGIQPACPKGMNESRGKQKVVRTIMPAFELHKERNKERVIENDSVSLSPWKDREVERKTKKMGEMV